jgi:uncharacterized membrane protein YdjX (TVP38/TMEM64 family)
MIRIIKMKKLNGTVKIGKYPWIALVIVAFLAFLIAFLYYDRHNQLSAIIQNLGVFGIAVALLMMAVLCMTPMPSEGLVVLFLKIYGVYWGIVLSWVGSCLSALIIFAIGHHFGQKFLVRLVTHERFSMVDNWVKRKGSIGLFIARLLPIPAFVVNYIAAVIPSVKLWPYFWTAALSIIPYYVGTALVFLGVSKEIWIWLFCGSVALIAFWGTGYMLSRRQVK